jgi:hypothetical protein
MATRVKVTPFNLNFKYAAPASFTKEDQTRLFAEFAQGRIDEAKARNAAVLGAVPPYTVSVDGRLGAELTSAQPNNPIGVFVEFELVFEVVQWCVEMLKQHSPVKSGRYQQSHVVLADGVAVEGDIVSPSAQRITIVNTQPYSRKIERGQSSQAPTGVYQVVATMAAAKFSNVAKIAFGYETPNFGAIDEWAASPNGAAWAKLKRRGKTKGHAEWLRRQPAIIINMNK